MDPRETLLERLTRMLHWKKSRAFYAEKLGISVDEIKELFKDLKEEGDPDIEEALDKEFREDFRSGTAEINAKVSEEIKTLDDLIRVCNIDTKKWTIDKYVANSWGNSDTPYWQIKAWLSTKTKPKHFQETFTDFLEFYTPAQSFITAELNDNPNACVVINKQDQHHNKFDIYGDNNIQQRFSNIERAVKQTILKVSMCNNIERAIYIIGSDEFNSEWNSLTTKGTPQTNILGFHEAFELICQHEVRIINELLMFSGEIEIIYIPGNHDEYVGWHLIQWLKCYYRNQTNLTFDTTPFYTKPVLYSNTLMVFNHGDDQKMDKLAQNMPFQFKELFAQADHFYIFTGDKHHLLAKDIASVECYQIPSLSKSSSSWDAKKGHGVTKAQMFSFVIGEGSGMGDIIKKLI